MQARSQQQQLELELDSNPHPHSYTVVWTTLPLISAFLPTIGHVGIADSHGVIRDFSGPYTVTKGRFMCGPPRRVWHLDKTKIDETAYNNAVDVAARVYEGRMHNIFLDNCHSHVALTLNNLKYEGRDDWNMVRVWWAIWSRGKWVSPVMASKTVVPSVLFFGIIIVLSVVLPNVLR